MAIHFEIFRTWDIMKSIIEHRRKVMDIFGLYIELWLAITLISVVGVILLALLTLVIWGIFAYKRYPKSTEYKKYAFFIPARNEGNVIRETIASIRAMDYPQDKITIFILANNCSETDQTANIARELGEEVFELKDKKVNNVGMVLERFFEFIKQKYGSYSAFDGYVRLDADNLVHKDYLSRMNDAFCVNPTVITAYRANQNFNDGIRASLTCMLVTQCMIAFRMFSGWGASPIITGPGILIGASVVEKMGGWHCKSISEDCELSALLCKLKIRVHFCYDAIFYDEQANKMKIVFRQRLRWTKGTNQVFFKYWFTMIARVFSNMWKTAIFLVIGLVPMGLISVLFTLGFGIFGVVSAILTQSADPVLIWLIITAALNLIPGWFMGIVTFIVERKRIKLPWYKKVLYVLFNPLGYMMHTVADFCRCFIRVKWKPVPHGQIKNQTTT